jgi:hypothetical protein
MFLLALPFLIWAFLVHSRHGSWLSAALTLGVGIWAVHQRVVKGPYLADPIIEISEKEIIFRSFFYFPTKVERFFLYDIKSVEIVGPRGSRCFRVNLMNDTHCDVRPYYRGQENKALRFLKENLPSHIHYEEHEPPSLFSTIRGDW